MNTLFAAVRAVHYASAMLMMGELVFALAISGPVLRSNRMVREPGSGEDDGTRRRLSWIVRWSVVASLASAVAWLVIVAMIMSGLPLGEALKPDTLERVLGDTMFGRIWMVRLGVLVAFSAALNGIRESVASLAAHDPRGRHARTGRRVSRRTGIVRPRVRRGQWARGRRGHRIGCRAPPRRGAWLGALPALVFLLGRAPATPIIVGVTRRFSALGMCCVALLAASGVVNAWHLVGSVPALLGTGYGRLLLAKVTLFVAMVVLAAANRWYHAVHLAAGDRDAAGKLRRNAILEIVAGGGILVVVGFLGISVPAVHHH